MQSSRNTSSSATHSRKTSAGAGKQQLRAWLRLLSCSKSIEGEVRSRLRSEFSTTLPRFDVLAQLDAAGGMLTMGEISERLMVTNGNVTTLIDAMEKDQLVARKPHPEDRRSTLIVLTRGGRKLFDAMAPAHQQWIAEAMQAMTRTELQVLISLLEKLKTSTHALDAV